MQFCLIGHNFRYEIEKLIRIFLPFEKIEYFDNLQNGEFCLVSEFLGDTAKATLNFGGKVFESLKNIENKNDNNEKDRELFLALAVYDCFTAATGYFPDWGILTGIRPAKLFSRLKKERGETETQNYFANYLKVNPKKLSLCKETLRGEGEITALSSAQSFSLYISIPFCPTRCSYCSFVSHSVESAKKLMPEYVKLLCDELIVTSKIAKEHNLKLETIYIGGGTPTTLSSSDLTVIMKTVNDNFDLRNLREYTVEAGRPDTITREKLLAIKSGGATRISINPQTMNDDVLRVIGRNHTSKQTIDAFNLARECGFNNINTDLIAGLPTDTFESFKDTLNAVLELHPESVTVHSLSMKRSSKMTRLGEIPEIEVGKTASRMVDFALEKLRENEIFPYYMYRQSKTVGNLENVGYSKRGFECLYNVFIMDETHTILSCGASAVTKLRQPNGDYIERIFNFKYPFEYINNFEEIINRKKRIGEFYNTYKT
ncbi:MAG: coproporphyrinogen dehydrogenase HemZ [Clostridia bacterium]|nr:coproporphyrinogen dehydrogenase HemZ [Clostridia bacterium]